MGVFRIDVTGRKMMNKRILPLAGFCLLFAMHAPVAAATADDPQVIVRETTEQVLQTLRKEGDALKKDQQRLYKIVNELILPHFDFRQMSKWVLGRYWRQASASQQDEFIRQFELLLVRTYSDALVEFRNQTMDFLPTRARSDTEVTVRSMLNQDGGPPVPITYQMHKVDNTWKAFDIAINGVSLVINYRSSFAKEIQSNGMDGLIKRLAEKNQSERG
jgi:phospholipid transport system substrate-binding protein